MDELDAYDWDQSGALDAYLTHADAIEREARPLPAPLDVKRLQQAERNLRKRLRERDPESCLWMDGWQEHVLDLLTEYARLASRPSTEPAQGGTE